MEITGVITAITEVQTGTSTKGDWAKRTIVMRENDAEYPNEFVLSLFKNGENIKYVTTDFGFNVNDFVRVEYNSRANEYKGKWYGDNSIWRIEQANAPTQSPGTTPSANPVPSPNDVNEDDLPF